MNNEMEQIIKIVKVMKGLKKTHENYLKNVGAKYDLSGPQIEILWIVAHRDGITISDLTELALIHISTTMHLVNILIKNGLVTKRNAVHDRRTWHVSITSKGKTIVNEVINTFINSNNPILSVVREVQAEQDISVDQFIEFGMKMIKKMNGDEYFNWVNQNSKEIGNDLINSMKH